MAQKCRIADLKYKEVINVETGERLGYPRDIEVNTVEGTISSLVVPGKLKFLGILGRLPDAVIPWEQVEKIGDDIILVHYFRKIEAI